RCAEITRWRSTKSTVPAAICQARLQLAQGNPHEAHTALIRAQQELRSWEAEQEVTHIAAHIAMLQLAMQETAAVTYWQQKTRLDTQSPATYANELVLMTVARLLIAQGVDEGQPAFTAALGLLERLYQNAKSATRNGRVIEIRILQALTRWAAGEEQAALTALGEALVLAEPEGYIRTFVDEGAPMAQLLYKAAAQQLLPDYVGRLLAAFDEEQLIEEMLAQTVQQRMATELVEPLTAREIEVLQLIADGMTNQEVANALVLTVSTVKVHTRNIYGKLGVRSRTQAVAKARTFGVV
ncbi:MAG: hypothetical protein KDE53_34965, partial [Caldilineaceae bacterium]|nr:hypothetical protein [Caldilineaceae bacterium]